MKHFAGKHAAIAALASFGLGLAAVPAAGADTSCNNGFLNNGTINGNLVVQNGAGCTLMNETVTGSVTVGTGATLEVHGGTIGGSIQASHCSFVRLFSDVGAVSVGRNVEIEYCAATSGYNSVSSISGTPITIISGNFRCSNNSALCDAEVGSVGGNVQVNNNTCTAEFPCVVGGNTIGGNLSCQGNTNVTDNNVPNTVAGHKLGQCAGL
jgi:hypothetical protein